MPLPPISAPIAIRMDQAGTSSEMKASDSAKASAPTIGPAHTSWTRTKSTNASVKLSMDMRGAYRGRGPVCVGIK